MSLYLRSDGRQDLLGTMLLKDGVELQMGDDSTAIGGTDGLVTIRGDRTLFRSAVDVFGQMNVDGDIVVGEGYRIGGALRVLDGEGGELDNGSLRGVKVYGTVEWYDEPEIYLAAEQDDRLKIRAIDEGGFLFTHQAANDLLFTLTADRATIQNSIGSLDLRASANLELYTGGVISCNANIDMRSGDYYDIEHLFFENGDTGVDNSFHNWVNYQFSASGGGGAGNFEITTTATSFSVSGGIAWLRETNSPDAKLYVSNVAALADTPINQFEAQNIYARWNGGSPALFASVNPPASTSGNDEVLVGIVVRDETGVTAYPSGWESANFFRDYFRRLDETNTTASVGGLFFDVKGVGITFDSGIMYVLHDRYVLQAFDSTGSDTFTQVWSTGNNTGVSDWNGLEYDTGVGLALLNNNRFNCNWYYRSPTGAVYELVGPYNTTSVSDIALTPKQAGVTVPDWLEQICVLAAQLVFQQGGLVVDILRFDVTASGGGGGGGGGATTFLGLTDTPADYTGQGGKLVSVTSGADGLEFTNAPAAGVTNPMTADLDAGGFNIKFGLGTGLQDSAGGAALTIGSMNGQSITATGNVSLDYALLQSSATNLRLLGQSQVELSATTRLLGGGASPCSITAYNASEPTDLTLAASNSGTVNLDGGLIKANAQLETAADITMASGTRLVVGSSGRIRVPFNQKVFVDTTYDTELLRLYRSTTSTSGLGPRIQNSSTTTGPVIDTAATSANIRIGPQSTSSSYRVRIGSASTYWGLPNFRPAIGGLLVAASTTTVNWLNPGTSGYVLTSRGSGLTPTWQAAAGGGVENPLTADLNVGGFKIIGSGTTGPVVLANSAGGELIYAVPTSASTGHQSSTTHLWVQSQNQGFSTELRSRNSTGTGDSGITVGSTGAFTPVTIKNYGSDNEIVAQLYGSNSLGARFNVPITAPAAMAASFSASDGFDDIQFTSEQYNDLTMHSATPTKYLEVLVNGVRGVIPWHQEN